MQISMGQMLSWGERVHAVMAEMILNALAIIVFTFSVIQHAQGLRKITYHIRPMSESQCPYKNCLTLSEYASATNRWSNSSDNLKLVFLPGEHILNVTVVFQWFESLTLLGSQEPFPNFASSVTCKNAATLTIANIPVVEIAELSFISCGAQAESTSSYMISETYSVNKLVKVRDILPSVHVFFVTQFYLTNCHMVHNYLPLLLNSSTAYLKGNRFVKNRGGIAGALAAYNSTVVLTGCNLFMGNEAAIGGGIFTNESNLVLKGPTVFLQNHAKYFGGGITSIYSNITCQSPNINSTYVRLVGCNNSNITSQNSRSVIHNLIHLMTTGIPAQYSSDELRGSDNGTFSGESDVALDLFDASLGGLVIFSRNLVESGQGGAVFLKVSYWSSAITVSVNNSATLGGAFYSESCQLHFGLFEFPVFINSHTCFHFDYTSDFSNNFAASGGAINAKNSTLEFRDGSNFENNSGSLSGGGMVVSQCTILFDSVVRLKGNYANLGGGIWASASMLLFSSTSYFLSNWARSDGGGIVLESWSSLNVSGYACFFNNTARDSGGGISVLEGTVGLDGTGTIVQNSAGNLGGALSVARGIIDISGEFEFVENMAHIAGGALHVEDGNLHLSGVNNFACNVAGSGHGGAIHAAITTLIFSGTQNFTNNSARYGGALAIESYGRDNYLLIEQSAAVSFIANYAEKHGGAIFVDDVQDHYCGGDLDGTKRFCFIRVDILKYPYNFRPVNLPENFYETHVDMYECIGRVTFEHNFAVEGGTAIYGWNMHTCKVELSLNHPCKYGNCKTHSCYMSGLEALAGLMHMSTQQIANDPLFIAFNTYKVCICDSGTPVCKRRNHTRIVYPGATTTFTLVAVGEKGAVPAVIHAGISGAHIGELQSTQNASVDCSSLRYTLLSNRIKSAKLSLTTEGPCKNLGIPLFIHVNFHRCPVGFDLTQSGSCRCERRLQKYTNSCDIDSVSFTRNGEFWMGFDSHDLILHPHCPFDYCTLDIVTFTVNSTDLQCIHGRSGTLCGACKAGLSLNFGSSRCSSCSNVFLLLFLPFAVAGFLLVMFLFICKVTVAAGTTSGLIFYANVLAVNRNVFFPSGEINFLTVFIAWLNLDLGIETCFFNGMSAYTQTWLQFVFPLYIWLLVGLITLASRYSMTVSKVIGPTNPIAVLATLFLLSYTKLLRTIIATFSFTTLEYPNDRKVTVWVYDGNIGYFEGQHIPLFLTGLLAFLFLFLPYTLILLFGQCIEAGSNRTLLRWANNFKVRSFLDAYYGPYKNKHRYWTGLLLLLRSILFTVSAVIDINAPRTPSVHLLIIGTAIVGLMSWTWNIGSVYKNRCSSILELLFILNLAVLVLASYQVNVEGGAQEAVSYTSVSIAFIAFLVILVLHISGQVQDSRSWRVHVRPRIQRWKDSILNHRRGSQGPTAMPIERASPPPVTTTFIDLRESLLESH